MFARFNRRIRISACCDRDVERARRFARQFNVPAVFQDYGQLLEEAPLDAVYLAVPHHLHFDMLCRAIARGLPAFVEKPITRTLAEGEEIIVRARESGVPIGVNYQYRYDRAMYALARGIQTGYLGTIHAARLNLPWRREQGYFTGAAWHASLAQAGGGTLLTQGSHLLDAALWAIGRRPVSAMGYTTRRIFTEVEVEDLAQGSFELEGGALLQISSSMVANPEGALSMEMYGEHGTARYKDKPWSHLQVRGVSFPRARPPHWGLHAVQRSLEGFRAWIQEGQPYLCPAEQALPALAAVEAVYASARTGQRTVVSFQS